MPTTENTIEPCAVTTSEAATIFSCSKGTVNNMIRLGKLNPIRLGTAGKVVRILKSDIERLIDEQQRAYAAK